MNTTTVWPGATTPKTWVADWLVGPKTIQKPRRQQPLSHTNILPCSQEPLLYSYVHSTSLSTMSKFCRRKHRLLIDVKQVPLSIGVDKPPPIYHLQNLAYMVVTNRRQSVISSYVRRCVRPRATCHRNMFVADSKAYKLFTKPLRSKQQHLVRHYIQFNTGGNLAQLNSKSVTE